VDSPAGFVFGGDGIETSPMSSERKHWRRTAIAIAVMAMGLVDLASALLSHPPQRLHALLHMVPTEVLDTSRTFTLLAGALLLVTAWGLRRGKRRAFVAALFLCAISVPVNLLKALDFEEATVAAALMFVLGVSAESFRVKSREMSAHGLQSRALLFFGALIVYAVVGCWWLEGRHGGLDAFGRAVAEAAYQLLGIGSPSLEVPRNHRIVVWFLDSISLLGLTGLVGLALAALQPATHARRHRTELDRVRTLLAAHGASSVSAFALADDTDYFFSSNGRAVIAYRFESDALLVIGDPIGPEDELEPLLRDFAVYCQEHDWQFAFFQAMPERLALYRAQGWRPLHIGEDPLLLTQRFTMEGSAIRDARRSVRKAVTHGIQARHILPDELDPTAATQREELMDELRSVSHAWVRAHHGEERGFCMGRFDPHRLKETWLAVGLSPSGRVEGFISWVPVPARRGWALDLMRRRDDAIAHTMDFLIVSSVDAARERGDAMLSLSLSALARVPSPGDEPLAKPNAMEQDGPDARPHQADTEDRARQFLLDHLTRFYDFKGLFQWKKKFDPVFEHRYLVIQGPMALPHVAVALARAQSRGGLLSYLRRARDVATRLDPRASSPPAPAEEVTGRA
jgi:phosphatidylglycerol lysyltransferase